MHIFNVGESMIFQKSMSQKLENFGVKLSYFSVALTLLVLGDFLMLMYWLVFMESKNLFQSCYTSLGAIENIGSKIFEGFFFIFA